MAKPFDAAAKELLQRYPRDWLAMIGWPVPATDDAITVVDADLSTVSPAADKIVRVDGVPVPYVAHVEFQSTGDADLDRRMMMYNVLTRHHHGWPVRSVAVLFRPLAEAGSTGRFDERLDAASWVSFGYHRLRVWELSAAALLAGPLGTVPLAPLAVDVPGVPGVIVQVRRRLETTLTRGQTADMLECVRNLLGVRFSETEKEALLMPASMQKLIEDESWTYKQTIERGQAQGRAQGRVEGRVAQLLEVGTGKFGPPPAAVAQRLATLTDVDAVRRLATRLLSAASWDELLSDA